MRLFFSPQPSLRCRRESCRELRNWPTGKPFLSFWTVESSTVVCQSWLHRTVKAFAGWLGALCAFCGCCHHRCFIRGQATLCLLLQMSIPFCNKNIRHCDCVVSLDSVVSNRIVLYSCKGSVVQPVELVIVYDNRD